MVSFTFTTMQQQQSHCLSIALCKNPSPFTAFNFHCFSHFLYPSTPKHEISQIFVDRRTHARAVRHHFNAKLSTKGHEASRKFTNFNTRKETGSGFSSSRSRNGGGEINNLENIFSSVLEGKAENKRLLKDKVARKMGSRSSSLKSKKDKVNSPSVNLRGQLDMCSKRGDVMGAIQLYDKALKEGITMGQYHYAVLLYLCSSAAVGFVQPAKSGTGNRPLNMLQISNDIGNSISSELAVRGRRSFDHIDSSFFEKNLNRFSKGSAKPYSQLSEGPSCQEDDEIWVSEDVKKYALVKGFEIYEKMRSDNVPMNEATLTAVARMAMSMGNGDMAFDMVKKMKPLGINPKLRSYGPALSVFCSTGDVDKAFEVEKHMLEDGVQPEEPELEALLRVSVGAGKGDKVYYLLHKLRTSVRKVSPSTADVIVKWFESKAASRVGKRKIDKRLIKVAIENGGGGWHGQGWLGKGKWSISHTVVGADALCKCCGEKLALIDLDPVETEKFAESVASIAIKREKNFSFQKFQKWLDYYGPFEAVVDAANVGLFSQKRFMPSKVNAVVNAIRQKLPSRRWPLIVLHNRRITGRKMDEPVNKAIIEKWKNADALYATPTGSNDDWYWLYAAIKFKCLIVTNDEMRDHTFQLLGNDFFPKWKERHQVHFSFSNAGPVFHMPPPCSVVIQESDKGHWHIPIASELDYDSERTWLCIRRANSLVVKEDSATLTEDSQPLNDKEHAKTTTQTKVNSNSPPLNDGNYDKLEKLAEEIYKNITDISFASVCSDQYTVLSEIEAAENLGNCVIDFQI
ncbi:proteinaceous RNase P 1, chloroplastic/mitochondrial-like [Hibiscus syriacus]|uniref:proteinaceous RNase P 1, chloroplastic/mitochondrial-like n=1 Tax=Hibiscus syriacus TaxID=106335 RepID=UPI00192212C8|nr:proteinaceous RNase P 1, chloroplastic/mitochondrial-like [Hibiscus syriacus]